MTFKLSWVASFSDFDVNGFKHWAVLALKRISHIILRIKFSRKIQDSLPPTCSTLNFLVFDTCSSRTIYYICRKISFRKYIDWKFFKDPQNIIPFLTAKAPSHPTQFPSTCARTHLSTTPTKPQTFSAFQTLKSAAKHIAFQQQQELFNTCILIWGWNFSR